MLVPGVEHLDTLVGLGTGLDHIDTNVIGTGVDLLSHELGWCLMYAGDTLSVLSCQGGRCGHSIAAMRSDDFLVGLKPSVVPISFAMLNQAISLHLRATGAIRPGYDQYTLHLACGYAI